MTPTLDRTNGTRRRKSRTRGFSIIELMVAITIGAILLGGAVTLFVNNRQTYSISTDLARLQENARFALDLMTRDIRMAGYVGCFNNLAGINDQIGDGGGVLWDPRFEIEGIDNAVAPTAWLPSNNGVAGTEGVGAGDNGEDGVIVQGTDAITLRYLNGSLADRGDPAGGSAADGTPDLLVTASTQSSLTVNHYQPATMADLGFGDGLVAGVATCGAGDLFQIQTVPTAADDGTIDIATPLGQAYSSDASPRVAPYYAVRYYVGNDDQNEPTLFRARIGLDGGLVEEREPLFEGVENMQILYGVDTRNDSGQPLPDGVPDVYLPANGTHAATGADLTNSANQTWNRVVAVRIALLLRTPQFGRAGEAAADTQSFDLFGEVVNPTDDRRRRRLFHATALVRNMQATN